MLLFKALLQARLEIMFTVLLESSTVLLVESSTTNRSRREEPGILGQEGHDMGRVRGENESPLSRLSLIQEHRLVVVVVDILFFKGTETPRLQVMLSVGNLLLTMLASWLAVC